MNDHELMGYVASVLVLGTFWMRSMLALRLMAIGSNVAFIAYAHAAGIQPVLVLHLVLLPLNIARILPALRGELRRRLDAAAARRAGAFAPGAARTLGGGPSRD